jgi:hypothetical protein
LTTTRARTGEAYPRPTLIAVRAGSAPTSPAVVVAATVVSLEAAALTGFGAWELWRSGVETASNRAVAEGSTAYFLVLGLLVAVVAFATWRRHRWSYGAAVFLQLLALPVAWTMATAGFWAGAVVLGAAAAAGLVALLAASGRAALGR